MKLQSQISRVYKGEKYEKSWVVIAQELLKKLNWKTGQELEAEVKNESLVIRKKKT